MIRRVDDAGDGLLSVASFSDGSLDDDRDGADAVVRAARRVLEIVPGERRLLPEFGCRIHALEGLGSARERALAAALVEDALERWAPDLEVDRADVKPSTEGWIRVTLFSAGRRHELEMKHRGRAAGLAGSPSPVGSLDRASEEPPA